MYGVLFFVGVYFTLDEEFSASSSSLRLLFYLPGLGVGAYLATYLTMDLCNICPRNPFSPSSSVLSSKPSASLSLHGLFTRGISGRFMG
jgi:hypothetical protein